MKPYAFSRKSGIHSWQLWKERERCRRPEEEKGKPRHKVDPEVDTGMIPRIAPDSGGRHLGNSRRGIGVLSGVRGLTHQNVWDRQDTGPPKDIPDPIIQKLAELEQKIAATQTNQLSPDPKSPFTPAIDEVQADLARKMPPLETLMVQVILMTILILMSI